MTTKKDPNIPKGIDVSFQNIPNLFQNPLEDPAFVSFVNPLQDPKQYSLSSVDTSEFLKNSPYFSNLLTGSQSLNVNAPWEHIEIQPLEDQRLSSIHEPMAEQKKEINELKLAIYELQLNDERKDIIIQELQAKLEKKRRKSKTAKGKSKSNERTKLNKKISKLEKQFSFYEPDLVFMHDMHKEEAKDLTKE